MKSRPWAPILLVECKWGDQDVDRALRYLATRFPAAKAWLISATGRKDFVTTDGIRVAPTLELLTGAHKKNTQGGSKPKGSPVSVHVEKLTEGNGDGPLSLSSDTAPSRSRPALRAPGRRAGVLV